MKLHLVAFALLAVGIIYAFNSVIARKFKRINPKTAFLYISAVAVVGVFGEVIVGNIYNSLYGKHLWDYVVYPIDSGFTSYYAPFIWGIYGFYLYLAFDTLLAQRKKVNALYAALVFCGETVFIEVLADWLYKLIFGQYLFYYFPNDLWHFSSLRGDRFTL